MTHLNKISLILALIATAQSPQGGPHAEPAPILQKANGEYDKKHRSFFLGHFDRMKDLDDSSCRKFNERVLRGGQPKIGGSNSWVRTFRDNRVATVFDLRAESAGAAAEREQLLKNGIGYVKLPLETSGSEQEDEVTLEIATPPSAPGEEAKIEKIKLSSLEATARVLKMMEAKIEDASGDSIYLHCQRGEDRTGLMVALLRDCSNDAWKHEFRSYGGTLYKSLANLMEDVQLAPF